MPKQQRFKTSYKGVYYILGTSIAKGKPERIYYITYRRDGRLIEEKAGRAIEDDMTPARAAQLRAQRIAGAQESNQARREAQRAKKDAEANRWTFARLWEEYKAQRPNLKGIVTDENRFQNYIRPSFGDKQPGDLTPFDVDRVRVSLLRKRSPATVRNVLELLRRIVNFGTRKRLSPPLPFSIEMPKVNNLKTEDLTPEQLTALLDAIEENPCEAGDMMKLALFSGMRRGEMFKLKWQDIDFERGFIHIRDPRGGPDQTIPLNDMARGLLDGRVKTSDFVFPGRGGEQRTDIKKQANRVKEQAELPKDFRALHGLRHTYATMLASSGQVDMYTLQKLLTHKSPLMTQRYAHLRDETLRRASDLAGRLVDEVVRKAEGREETREAQAG
jgi:integrase